MHLLKKMIMIVKKDYESLLKQKEIIAKKMK